MKINGIVACDLNRAIGKGNNLLCHLKGDLQFFKAVTQDAVVIMGRKTWESLPRKPLPNRINVILTTDTSYTVEHESVHVAHNKSDALRYAKLYADRETFVIGGAQIYDLFKEDIGKMYITIISHRFKDADTFLDTDFMGGTLDTLPTVYSNLIKTDEEYHYVPIIMTYL